MNCAHCFDLIEAHPLGALTPSQRAAIARHISHCDECRELLAFEHRLDDALLSLAEPVVPSGFDDLVMRRLLDTDEAKSMMVRDEPDVLDQERTVRPMLVGGAIALGAQCLALFDSQVVNGLFAPVVRGGAEGLARMPESGSVAIGLAIGLVLMMAGLLESVATPVSSDRTRARRIQAQ